MYLDATDTYSRETISVISARRVVKIPLIVFIAVLVAVTARSDIQATLSARTGLGANDLGARLWGRGGLRSWITKTGVVVFGRRRARRFEDPSSLWSADLRELVCHLHEQVRLFAIRQERALEAGNHDFFDLVE